MATATPIKDQINPGIDDVVEDALRHGNPNHGKDHTMVLNMGPQHPSTHGVLRLVIEIDGETVVALAPDIGYLHTGIEKTCEAKFYQQVVPLTDRIDYLSPMLLPGGGEVAGVGDSRAGAVSAGAAE